MVFDCSLSVIVPVYNAGKYIDKLFDALERQTFQNFDLILVNDGSKDDSEEKIKAYMACTSRKCTYICQTNQGAGAARNAGLKACSADFYAFLDSDDLIADTYLEKMTSACAKYEADIVIAGVGVFKNGIYSEKDSESATEELVLDSVDYARKVLKKEDASYIVANKLIRNTGKLFFPEGLMFEDMFFASGLAWSQTKVVFIPEQRYFYMINSEPVSHTRGQRQILDFTQICRLVVEGYAQSGMMREVRSELLGFLDTAQSRLIRKYTEQKEFIQEDIFFQCCDEFERMVGIVNEENVGNR